MKSKTKKNDSKKQYDEIIHKTRNKHSYANVEWKKNGDTFKKFSIYKDEPDPITFTNTSSISRGV